MRAVMIIAAVGILLQGCASQGSPAPTATGTAASGFNEAIRDVQNAGASETGTLRVLVAQTCVLGDPRLITEPACANLLRTTTRQLMAYSSLPGRYGSVVVPDLAETAGISTDGGVTWTYRLRRDAVWSDGTPITAEDARAGIVALDESRVDVDVTEIGTNGQELRIVLRVAQPALDQLLALPSASPRNKGLSSGPFLVEQEASDSSPLVLVRNEAWKQSADPIRTPHATRIEVSTIRPATKALEVVRSGVADVSLVTAIDPMFADALLADPLQASLVDNPGTGAMVYLSLMNPEGVWKQPTCRQGLFSAVNRTAVVEVLGGTALAHLATTMSAPTIASYEPSYRPFSVGDGGGDVDAARLALANCGAAPRLRLGYPKALKPVADQLVRSLKSAGVAASGVEVNSVSPAESADGMRANVDAMLVQRFAEVPGVWGFWGPLLAPLNLANADALLASPEATSTDPDVQADVGRLIDRLVLDSAQYIPLAYVTTVSYRPATLTNVATSGAFANTYDVVNIGVS